MNKEIKKRNNRAITKTEHVYNYKETLNVG